MTMLTDERKRFVEATFQHYKGAWKAPFKTILNDVMVNGPFYWDDDYDEIKSYLTERFGND